MSKYRILNSLATDIFEQHGLHSTRTNVQNVEAVDLRLHHSGIVVESVERTAAQYRDFFGPEPVSGIVTDAVQQVKMPVSSMARVHNQHRID